MDYCYAEAELDRWMRQNDAIEAMNAALSIEEDEMIANYCELQAWHLREAGYVRLADEVEASHDPCFADDLIAEVLGA